MQPSSNVQSFSLDRDPGHSYWHSLSVLHLQIAAWGTLERSLRSDPITKLTREKDRKQKPKSDFTVCRQLPKTMEAVGAWRGADVAAVE